MDGSPLITVGQSRSGTSLLIKILMNHGYEIGRPRPAGRYPNNENAAVHAVITSKNPDPRLVRNAFFNDIPDGSKGVLKSMINRHQLYLDAFPDATWLFSIRDPEAVCESLWRKGRTHLHPKHMMGHALAKNAEITEAAGDATIVQMSRLMEGDYSSLEKAMSECELVMDADAVRNAINPTLWTCQ